MTKGAFVILGQVAIGVGLAAGGAGFYAFARWQGSDDDRMRRMAQNRWWADRRTVRKVRRGQMSKEEWFSRFARQYRGTVRWVFGPFTVLMVVAGLATVIHGLTSRR